VRPLGVGEEAPQLSQGAGRRRRPQTLAQAPPRADPQAVRHRQLIEERGDRVVVEDGQPGPAIELVERQPTLEERQRDGVEGPVQPTLARAGRSPEQLVEADSQRLGRLGREGQDRQVLERHPDDPVQEGRAMEQHGGLAAADRGPHQGRRRVGHHRGLLVGIERDQPRVEPRIERGHRRHPRRHLGRIDRRRGQLHRWRRRGLDHAGGEEPGGRRAPSVVAERPRQALPGAGGHGCGSGRGPASART
jgi:hypothetical protein